MKYGLSSSFELSLLDKLCLNSGTMDERIKSGLVRDIEDLLNTQIRAEKCPEKLTALDDSLLYFGVTDFTTSFSFRKYSTHNVLNYIKSVIEIWEPRLTRVHLEDISENNDETCAIQIRIIALAYADGSLHEISLDTLLDLNSGEFQAKG